VLENVVNVHKIIYRLFVHPGKNQGRWEILWWEEIYVLPYSREPKITWIPSAANVL
jgi:hypothetical protein